MHRPAASVQIHLNVTALVKAAKDTNADVAHPGYGFSVKSVDFVCAVEAARMIFIGPSAATIERMGDKVSARQEALAAFGNGGISIA